MNKPHSNGTRKNPKPKDNSNYSGHNFEALLSHTDLHPNLKAEFIIANPPATSALLSRTPFTVSSNPICS